mmetsp:Transcript_65012/g.173319  ORF Transcript_65012/g.173319 Transcript_65012/m.173319 type:complete len:204 (+) Transcript_65012:299-910(+)
MAAALRAAEAVADATARAGRNGAMEPRAAAPGAADEDEEAASGPLLPLERLALASPPPRLAMPAPAAGCGSNAKRSSQRFRSASASARRRCRCASRLLAAGPLRAARSRRVASVRTRSILLSVPRSSARSSHKRLASTLLCELDKPLGAWCQESSWAARRWHSKRCARSPSSLRVNSSTSEWSNSLQASSFSSKSLKWRSRMR